VADRAIYTFGDVRVDLGRMTVFRGASPVPLEPKAFDVLVYLLEHRDRLVTKDELLDAAWAGTFVTPNVLTRAIAQIRKGLGDESHEARYIETVARRGYRFIASAVVERGDPPTASVTVASPPATAHRRMSRRAMAIATAGLAIVCAAGTAVFLLRHAAARELSIRRITATGNVIDAIVSPDGKYVAYVESDAGLQALYLRQITGARPIELVPAASVAYWQMAFAPDGQSIFYGLRTKSDPAGVLLQVPVLGGTSRRILSGIDSGVTFSPDGSQLAFYRVDGKAGASAIVIARTDGTGERVVVTKRPPEFLGGFFAAPSWSPDGARISAFVRNGDTRFLHMVMVDVASGAEASFSSRYRFATCTLWARNGAGIFYVAAPPGTLPSGTGGQIYFQPFPTGDPVRITNDIIEYRNISATADGHSIVSVGFDLNSQLFVVPYEGGEPQRVSAARWDGSRGLEWMPDGRHILFTRPQQVQYTIWSAASDGSDARQLPLEGMALWPNVSPDGRTLVFSGGTGNQSGIWRAALDGSGRQLLVHTSNVSSVSVAPAGIAYYSTDAEGVISTFRVPVSGGNPELLAPSFFAGRVSHNGRMLAGVYRQSPSAPFTYAILDAQSGKVIRSLYDFGPGAGTTSPAWTPDDSAVLYTTSDRKNIWRQDLNGGVPQRVTSFSDLIVFSFAPSPDGRTLLLARGTMVRDAFLISNVR
jgi:DNA-binding winged helix-turn-helix (wHTH) protein/Tol biopolymer transport system component